MRALLVVALVAGCGRPIRHDPHEGQHKLTFHNLSGGSVCAVLVYPVAQDQQGSNRLAPDTELRNGDLFRLWLVPGDYQVRATGCSYEKLNVTGYVTNVRLNMDGNVVLYRADDAKSNEAAVRVAHETENTYLVVAKLQFVKNPTPRTRKELDSEKPPLAR